MFKKNVFLLLVISNTNNIISLGDIKASTALLFPREETFPFPAAEAMLLLLQQVIADYNFYNIKDYFVSVIFLNCDTIWK